MNDNERCETCTFFDRTPLYSNGLCRRYAPIVVATVIDGQMTAWPKVTEKDWCGEYEHRNQS